MLSPLIKNLYNLIDTNNLFINTIRELKLVTYIVNKHCFEWLNNSEGTGLLVTYNSPKRSRKY